QAANRTKRAFFVAFATGVWQPKIEAEDRSRGTPTGPFFCPLRGPTGTGVQLRRTRMVFSPRDGFPISPSLPEGRGMSDRTEGFKENGLATVARKEVFSGEESLPADRCLDVHRIMVRTRALEERMIKMSKSGLGHFWIGGPGEEAFNACLGFQIKKGMGPAYDYLHLHYRNSATLVAMGMSLLDGIRQMAMTATDPHSMGRNFSGPFARREWN